MEVIPRQSYQYTVLNVFARKSFEGNPLAVVFTETDLETAVYANMAKDFGYSETSFIYYSISERALKVRSVWTSSALASSNIRLRIGVLALCPVCFFSN